MENNERIFIEEFKNKNVWDSFTQQMYLQQKEDEVINQHN